MSEFTMPKRPARAPLKPRELRAAKKARIAKLDAELADPQKLVEARQAVEKSVQLRQAAAKATQRVLEGEVLHPRDGPDRLRQAASAHLIKAQRPWRVALERVLLAASGAELEKVAKALVRKAKQGDVSAIKEIGDRLDGRAIQQVEAKVQASLQISVTDSNL